MIDPRLTKWADTLTQYSIDIQPGEQILIRADEAAIPLVKEVYAAVLRRGGHPHVQVNIDGLDEIFLKTAGEQQLDFVSPIREYAYSTVDSMIAIMAPTNTASLAGVDPTRQARAQKANGATRRAMFQRAAEGKSKWSLTLFPTPAAAQNAGMSLTAYEEFIFSAMLLNRDDPAEGWRELSRDQQKYVDYLNKVDKLRFVAVDTDISMRVGGRKWINSDGHRNFPSGEVFTGPIENTAEGHVRFTFPAAHLGNEVNNIQLEFREGKVVSAQASHGIAFLEAMLDSDTGARFLGEVAVGTNYGVTRFSRNTLYDEKIGGTFHMALGRSYPETGGVNESSLHWDLICDMRPDAGGGAIYADGVLIHENGAWKI